MSVSGDVKLYRGDALRVLKTLADASVDSIVTDPPAGIGFMGKEWDDFRRARNGADVDRPNVFGRTSARGPQYARRDRIAFIAFLAAILAECLRVAKPGAYALIWAIPRTSHWTGTAIEDAGWVIQDRISHLFGQGLPKHRSKLKPACEDWWLAWKPDRYATPLPGLDGCRIGTTVETWPASRSYGTKGKRFNSYEEQQATTIATGPAPAGRWPANVVLSGDAPAMLDEQSGERRASGVYENLGIGSGNGSTYMPTKPTGAMYGDTGGASRFFATFPGDPLCILCNMPYNRLCDKNQRGSSCKPTPASTAKRRSRTTPATTALFARTNAAAPHVERAAQNAKCAANLCDSCAIGFALALAEIQRSASSNAVSPAIPAFTGSSNNYSLIRSLAQCAASQGSIGTIPTTQSLSKLFGCVLPAIANFIRPENAERAAEGSDREQATRFRYVAKAGRAERNAGLGDMPACFAPTMGNGIGGNEHDPKTATRKHNTHPTVKPLALMRWLCRLITPPSRIRPSLILDPFAGSGSTAVACVQEGFGFVGIEREADYVQIARRRIREAQRVVRAAAAG